LKSGSLNLLEPSGPGQACNGIALLCVNYVIYTYIKDNNAVIMEDSKALFFSFKFPWAHKSISSKFIDNLGRGPQDVSMSLPWRNVSRTLNFTILLNSLAIKFIGLEAPGLFPTPIPPVQSICYSSPLIP
jgi:hypothetical protein